MCYCDTTPIYGTGHVHCAMCDAKVEAEQAGPGHDDIDITKGAVIGGLIYCQICAVAA